VSELEDAGIVHTNLNPDHILLSDDLQTVKLCGFVTAARQSSQQLNGDEYQRFLIADERVFRPIELCNWVGCYLKSLVTSSAMDVWSLGCILGYMLLNGEPLFSNSYTIFGEVVSFLGNPTVHEMQEGLLANYSLSSYGGRIALQNLQKKFGNNELTAVWIPTMDAIFRYLPSNRIKVKNLLKLVVDTSRTLPKDYRLSATTKTDQIKIEMNIVELKPRSIKEYFNTVFSFRKSIADDAKRFDRFGNEFG
jgi:serine/threonine protein kinase